MKTAIFALGCFWSPEHKFRQIQGVKDAAVGYIGGSTKEPTYEDVCSGTSGHAEAVKITYDESEITYEELLNIFFDMHDPTQVHRQGPDVGSQYRSAIFPQNQDQQQLAAKRIQKEAERREDTIATTIEKGTFWRAEDYHQQYFKKHPIRAKFMCG